MARRQSNTCDVNCEEFVMDEQTWPRIIQTKRDRFSPWMEVVIRDVQLVSRGPVESYYAVGEPDYVNALALTLEARVLLVSEQRDWHARQVEAAFRRLGARVARIDLADCGFDTQSPSGLALPGLGSRLPDAVLVRVLDKGSFEAITKRLGQLHHRYFTCHQAREDCPSGRVGKCSKGCVESGWRHATGVHYITKW